MAEDQENSAKVKAVSPKPPGGGKGAGPGKGVAAEPAKSTQAGKPQSGGPPVPPPAKPAGDQAESRWKPADWIQFVMMLTALVALIGNGIGLILVNRQLEQTNQSIGSNTLEQIYGRMHDINKFFVEHPELKPYFYENMEISDPNPLIKALGVSESRTRAQVVPLAEMMCDFFAQALIELKQLPPGAYEGWQNYIRDVYRNSPAMRAYYHKNEKWYQYEDAARLFQQVDREIEAARAKTP